MSKAKKHHTGHDNIELARDHVVGELLSPCLLVSVDMDHPHLWAPPLEFSKPIPKDTFRNNDNMWPTDA